MSGRRPPAGHAEREGVTGRIQADGRIVLPGSLAPEPSLPGRGALPFRHDRSPRNISTNVSDAHWRAHRSRRAGKDPKLRTGSFFSLGRKLCAGMGLRPTRSVLEAVGGRVPVEVCTLGVEAVTATAALQIRMRSVSSVLAVSTNRSTKLFALAHRGGISTVSMPAPARTASNDVVN